MLKLWVGGLAIIACSFVGSVKASDLNDSFNINIEVGKYCHISGLDNIVVQIQDIDAKFSDTNFANIACNKSLPYQLEFLGADPDTGLFSMTGINTNSVLSLRILGVDKENNLNLMVGNFANNSHISGVGNGSSQIFEFTVDNHTNDFLPKVDTYIGNIDVKLSF